jgi:disulfide bond formation protein DsbB
MSIELLNNLLGTGVLALQVITIGLIAALLVRSRNPELGSVVDQVADYAYPAAFVTSLAASVLTLYYSIGLGFDPCPLCVWQRVFLYPQVALFAALVVREAKILERLSIVLSVIGLGIAVYHHMLQMLPSGALPCPATGPSCSQIIFLEYGYITYPMMAATLFVFLIVLVAARMSRARAH